MRFAEFCCICWPGFLNKKEKNTVISYTLHINTFSDIWHTKKCSEGHLLAQFICFKSFDWHLICLFVFYDPNILSSWHMVVRWWTRSCSPRQFGNLVIICEVFPGFIKHLIKTRSYWLHLRLNLLCLFIFWPFKICAGVFGLWQDWPF